MAHITLHVGGFLTACSAKLTLQSEVHDQASNGGGRYIMPFIDLTVHSLPSRSLPSSSGFTNFSHSWVPRGSNPRTYSAPTIASNQLRVLLLIVVTNNEPPGFSRCEHFVRKISGLSTCSITSIASNQLRVLAI